MGKIVNVLTNLGFWFFVLGLVLGTFRKFDPFTAIALILSILFFALGGIAYLIKKGAGG